MMKRFLRVAMMLVLLCVVTVLLSALSFKTTEAKATTSKVSQNRYSSTSCQWSVVPSPNGSSSSGLSAVAAVSANDVWAVGSSGSQMSGGQTLIEHWNGSSWSVVKSPNPGSSSDHLTGVAAVSTSDVWAVGNGKTSSGKTLIEHWNGSSWSVVASPSPGSGGDLRAVAAVSAGNVWAVGYYSSNSSSIQTLVERWNGASWQVVKSVNVGTSPTFSAVAAVSAHDVWAVGSYHNSNSNTFFQTLTEQWNGTKWSVVKSPSPGSFSTQLLGVAAVSATNVWAVGYADSNTLVEHYH